MVIQLSTSIEQGSKKANVLATLAAMEQWPYWNEVYLNCVKESPLSYEAFAQSVQSGDASPLAFDNALRLSQMSQEDFDQKYLPGFQQFMALYTEYAPIGMLSDGVDQVWHAFLLISGRYREFCTIFFDRPVDHFPCSLYPLYGIELASMSCLNKCVPSTCKGGGGGCKPDEHSENPEKIKGSILAATKGFIDAYWDVFRTFPDRTIWNQLKGY